MPLDDTEILAREDEGIEAAAIALCWLERPALLYRNDPMEASGWWRKQTERDRRLYVQRARTVITAWERHMAVAEASHVG